MAIEQNRNIVVVLSRRKHKTKQAPEHWLSSTKEMDFFHTFTQKCGAFTHLAL